MKDEKITYSKCKTRVTNLIVGKLKIDNVGDMKFKNHKTNDTAWLVFENNYKVKGWVKNSSN